MTYKSSTLQIKRNPLNKTYLLCITISNEIMLKKINMSETQREFLYRESSKDWNTF